MPTAVILNSRQSKTPVGDDAWVVSTLAAVRHAVDSGLTLLSSVGLNTWELVTWGAGQYGGQLGLYIPCPFGDTICGSSGFRSDNCQLIAETICREFELHPARIDFYFHGASQTQKTRKALWPERDRAIIAAAEVIYPVAIRPKGNLEQLLAVDAQGKTVDERFRVRYEHREGRHSPLVSVSQSAALAATSWPCITHWTCSANGKWPGETAAAYYRDLARPGNANPRSALATLARILSEQQIRATSVHIRGGYRVISFTALPPGEAINLMRWRKRFVRWNFEPYGIAIRADAARASGVRPVMYGVPDDYARLDVSDQPFFQNRGVRGGDWTPEHEWRHLGDLDLSRIPADALKVIVRSSDDIDRVRQGANSEVIPLYA